jgi:hypothetical protein
LGLQTDDFIEVLIEEEIGEKPTKESLKEQGIGQRNWLYTVSDVIVNFTSVLFLVLSEVLQSVGVFILLGFFAVVEGLRIFSGSMALGQSEEVSILFAIALVSFNIWEANNAGREIKGDFITYMTFTLRGFAESVLAFIFGKSKEQKRSVYSTSLGKNASAIIFMATVLFSIFDLVFPIIQKISEDGDAWYVGIGKFLTESTAEEFFLLAQGTMASFGAVLVLRYVSWIMAQRGNREKPVDVNTVLKEEVSKYEQSRKEIEKKLLSASNNVFYDDLNTDGKPFAIVLDNEVKNYSTPRGMKRAIKPLDQMLEKGMITEQEHKIMKHKILNAERMLEDEME